MHKPGTLKKISFLFFFDHQESTIREPANSSTAPTATPPAIAPVLTAEMTLPIKNVEMKHKRVVLIVFLNSCQGLTLVHENWLNFGSTELKEQLS